jgi:hypothetical protein
MAIENTTHRDPMFHLLGAMSEGTSRYIEGMEADGQRQVVNSTDLPTKFNDYNLDDPKAAYQALGFKLGEPHSSDPLFRSATLPDGWKREGSDHAMWSYIVDELGRRRVAIFYKAAFYDRDAFMSLETICAYARSLSYDGDLPVYDDAWCTREAFAEQVAALRAELVRRTDEAREFAAQRDDDYWPRRASELADELKKYDAWAARVAAG